MNGAGTAAKRSQSEPALYVLRYTMINRDSIVSTLVNIKTSLKTRQSHSRTMTLIWQYTIVLLVDP